MILRNKLQEIGLEDLALALRDAVDPPGRDLVRRPKETLPASDGVGPDDRTRPHGLAIMIHHSWRQTQRNDV